MPVHLAHGAGLDGDEGHGKCTCYRKGRGVEDFDCAAGDLEGRLLAPVVGVALSRWDNSRRASDVLLVDILWRRGAGEYPELFFRQGREFGDAGVEVLRDDGFWVAQHEFGEEEGVFFAESAVVENEEEFAAVRQSLEGVRDPGGEEPYVAFLQVVDEGLAAFVEGRDSHAAVEYERPFSLFVPVELAVCVGLEAHVRAGHCDGGWELASVL